MWLLKTEPSTYGYDDLEREGRAAWDGVKNPAALANLRKMKEGDAAFIYHTGDEKAVVGTAAGHAGRLSGSQGARPAAGGGGPRAGGPAGPGGDPGRPAQAGRVRGQPAAPPAAALRGAAHEEAVERARADRARMTGPLVALSTVATAEDAERIARSLVEQGVAACVNVVPGMVSFYRWKGRLERDAEVLLDHQDQRGALRGPEGRPARRASLRAAGAGRPPDRRRPRPLPGVAGGKRPRLNRGAIACAGLVDLTQTYGSTYPARSG